MPKCNHQGIGKILLNYVKGKRNKLILNVYQKNTRAISFYQREGFEIQYSGLDEAYWRKRLCNGMAAEIENSSFSVWKIMTLVCKIGRKYGNGKREKSMSIYCRMAIRL